MIALRRVTAFSIALVSLATAAPGHAGVETYGWRGIDMGGAATSDDADSPAADLSIQPPSMADDALPKISDSDLKPRPYAKQLKTAAAIPGKLTTSEAADTPSRLEDAYGERIVDKLTQFGYDQFNAKTAKTDTAERSGMPAGAAQDDFILSAGDRLSVVFRGQRNSRQVYGIDAQGQLLVDDLPPVTAAGRSIGQVRDMLKAAAGTLPNTDLFVSLDAVRQIDVLIVGHVGKPGRQTLTVFNTVLDALERSGGIDKTGSLRQIKLVRDGRSTLIDLYGLLIYGSTAMDLSLRDGDRIIVPPVGATTAVAGAVKRPGIYELPYSPHGLPGASSGGDGKLSLQDMIDLGGGLLTPGQLRYVRMSLTADGKDMVREISDSYAQQFGDGDILSIAPAREKRSGTIELAGDVRRPGMHALDKAPLLSALLDSERIFGPDIYPLIGVIEREDEQQMTKQIISFPPLQVVKGKFDRSLKDGDTIRLFSREQIKALQGNGPPPARDVGSTDDDDDGPLTDPVLVAALKEHSAYIRGAVREPGPWPVTEGTTLDSAIAVAGGMTLEADPQDVEVTSASMNDGTQKTGGGQRRGRIDLAMNESGGVVIAPGDSVRVNQKFQRLEENSVLIAGQVNHPGRYDLLPGDHMSDLLKRAGGLTAEAYPQGSIFSRLSERRSEEQRFRAEAQNLETRLAAAMQDKSDKAPNADQIGAVEQLIGQLKNAQGVGRITVESDPDALASDPAVDILLESGDRIYVPQRPLTVRVTGEVLSPSSLQFRKDKDARQYITEAGGLTYNADESRSFVLYPDGSAQPLSVGSWSHSAAFIPPGSTIIVPRDPKPFDFIETARDITQILSNLAVTGIFIDNIQKN